MGDEGYFDWHENMERRQRATGEGPALRNKKAQGEERGVVNSSIFIRPSLRSVVEESTNESQPGRGGNIP